MIRIQCTHCGKKFKVPEEYEGKKTKCRNCKTPFVIQRIGPNDKSTLDGSHLNETVEHIEHIENNPSIDQLNEDANNHNSKTVTFADKVLRVAFSIANGVSALVVSLCLISITVLSAIVLFSILPPPSRAVPVAFSMPTFSQFIEQHTRKSETSAQKTLPDTSALTRDFKSQEIWYQQKLDDVCSKYGLDSNIVERWISTCDAAYISLFLSGLDQFLSDAEMKFVSEGRDRKSIQFQQGANYFRNDFDLNLRQHKQSLVRMEEYAISQEQSRMARIKWGLTGITGSISTLLLFLLLPLLIQIEKNTRTFRQFITQEE